MRAEDILVAYSLNSLRTMARARSVDIASTRRPDLIAALADQLFDPRSIAVALGRLMEGERALLNVVAEADGRLTRTALIHTLLDRGVIDDLGTGRPRESIDRISPQTRHFDELCARLTAAGLLFSEPKAIGPTIDPLDLSPGDVLFVPGPVLELLRRHADQGHESLSDSSSAPRESSPLGGRLLVQPSYAVLLLPPLDEPTMRRLGVIAETVRVAETAEFRLTQAAAYQAAQRGESLAKIVAFLEERSSAPLPQNVRYTLDAWAHAFEQARFFRDALLVEGPSDLLDRLENDSQLAPLIVRRLGEERLLLRDAVTAGRLIEELGEIPRHVRYGVHESPRCRIDEDGVITLDPDDLVSPITLRRLAEPLPDGRLQLTADRVRAAVTVTPDGLTGLLKQLRALAGELPPAVVAQLRLWSLPAGAVRLEQPLLLQVPREVLESLRADPDLAQLLADEYRPEAAVVRVAPDDLDQLLVALRVRGLIPDESSPLP